MRFRRWLQDYRGVVLIAIAAIATVWLGATKQLGLYIHPRYNAFSLVGCGLGLVAVILGIGYEPRGTKSASELRIVTLLIVVLSVVGLLIVKPATLSSDIANQRGVNSAASTSVFSKLSDADIISPFGSTSFTQLSIKDWASLLSQTNDNLFFVGKQASISGFITIDETDPNSRFFVSRFVVSCCTVDARPIGVPVYLPGWQSTYKPDQWLAVEGKFAIKNDKMALDAPKIEITEKPRDSYVY
jgi:putative membrane protein